jgi:hypothetical protein
MPRTSAAMISPLAASAAAAQRGRAKSRRAATAAKQTSVRKTVLILLRCGCTVKNDAVPKLRVAGYGFGTLELWRQPRLPTCYCQDNERLKSAENGYQHSFSTLLQSKRTG